jgi:cytoskeleton protein RodZ
MTDFGASFKKARESAGISLDQIAIETRISTRFLAAIEGEEFHLLPGGIFNRGFVRTYAERIGLDPDQAVAEYERLVQVREPGDTLAPAVAESPKPQRNLYPIVIGALVLLIIGFYIVTRQSGNTVQTAGQPSPAVAVTTSVPPEPPPTAPETTAAASVPTPSEPESVPPAATTAPAPGPPAAPAPPAVATEPAIVADLEITEPSWIRVLMDGNPTEMILEPGMTKKFTAQNSMTLTIGNAAGVTLKLNEKPMKPLGVSGQVREFVITPQNVKDIVAKGR